MGGEPMCSISATVPTAAELIGPLQWGLCLRKRVLRRQMLRDPTDVLVCSVQWLNGQQTSRPSVGEIGPLV